MPSARKEIVADTKDWAFNHDAASDTKWTPGLREIFEYRDLAIKNATKDDYIAHLVRHNGKKTKDEVQQWRVHDCTFQFVYVMNGWAKFEYEGEGVRTIRKANCVDQRRASAIATRPAPRISRYLRHAGVKTRVVEAPEVAGAGRGVRGRLFCIMPPLRIMLLSPLGGEVGRGGGAHRPSPSVSP